MRDYVVRSSVTRAESSARRAADVIIVILLCAAVLFVLFRFILVPVTARDPKVGDLNEGDLVLIDRVSKYLSEYTPGDIVRADIGRGLNAYRVVACGGCDVLVKDGCTYINGGLLDESEYASPWDGRAELNCWVPWGSVLLLPDDRQSIRSLEDCVVPVGEIFGKLRLRVYPFDKLGLFV